jgi:RecA/RadA recombinase
MGSNVDDIEQETALQWLIRLGCLKTCLSTGHEELDQLFHNTIPLRRILEVVGEDAVGKMQVIFYHTFIFKLYNLSL